MQKILTVVQEFQKGYQEAKEQYKKTMEIVDKTYIKDSDKYKERAKALKDERDAQINALKKVGLAMVEQEFASMKGRITKIVGVAPSEDMEKAISKLKGMTDMEKNMLYTQLKENASYMDMKMLNEAMGKPFARVDDLMVDMDHVEKSLNDYFNNYVANSYRCLNIEHGALLNALGDRVNEFVGQYAGSEE